MNRIRQGELTRCGTTERERERRKEIEFKVTYVKMRAEMEQGLCNAAGSGRKQGSKEARKEGRGCGEIIYK